MSLSIADLVRRLAAAGASPEAIAIAVEAVEEAQAQIGARRSADRERKRARREECSEQEWLVLRATVFARDGYACVYCGAEDQPLHCDHIIPFSRGGGSVLDNLATACGPCNSRKRDRTPDEWGRAWA